MPAQPRPSHTRRLARLALATALVAAVVLAAAVGAQSLWLARALDGTEGRRVDIGGRSIHLACSGEGRPSYVLEAGATGFVETWTWVREALARDARVCAHDRAGLGASDPAPGGFAPERVAADLKAALEAAGETGPHVLVGHSLGGIFVRLYAAAHPEDVAALVLVDPSHEDQLARFTPEMVAGFEAFRATIPALAHAARFGALHLWNPIEAGLRGLEGEALERGRAYARSPEHLGGAAEEILAWDAIMARVPPIPRDRPVLVVSAGQPMAGQPAMTEITLPLHAEMAAASAAGRHEVLPEADHFSILMDRERARELAALIRAFAAGL